MIRSNLSCSLLLVALGACGGISRTDQVGPESVAADSGGQSGGEFASSASAGRAAAGGSLGDLPACVPFKDQAPEPLTVKIRNDTASWIFLGPRSATCGIAPLFGVRASLTDDRGTPEVPDQPEPAGCRLPCQGLFDGNASDSCGGACAPTAVVRLGPGETVVSEWSGLVDVDEYMPSECDAVANNPWGVSCRVALREAPGSYEFHVEAGAAAMCGNGSTVCGQCLPDPRGGCTITGAIVTGDAFYGRIVVALDERDGLFGSAGGVNAASASPSRTLEVVVRDDP